MTIISLLIVVVVRDPNSVYLSCLFAVYLIARNIIGINNCDNWCLNNIPSGGNGLFLTRRSLVTSSNGISPVSFAHHKQTRNFSFVDPPLHFPFISPNPRVHISRHWINSPQTFFTVFYSLGLILFHYCWVFRSDDLCYLEPSIKIA